MVTRRRRPHPRRRPHLPHRRHPRHRKSKCGDLDGIARLMRGYRASLSISSITSVRVIVATGV